MTIEYKIVFSRWINPLQDISEDEELIYNLNNFEDPKDEDTYWKGEEQDQDSETVTSRKMSAIMTPVGIVPLNEYTDVGKIFNFWNGFTNFNVSETIHNIIEKISGVEILHVFTPYRFRFAVGKLFKPSEVFHDMQQQVLEYVNSPSEIEILSLKHIGIERDKDDTTRS